MMEGGGLGLEDGSASLMRDVGSIVDGVKRKMDFGTANIDFTSSGIGMSSSAIVNSVSGGGMGTNGPISLTIPVMLPDGTVLAKAMLSDLIKTASAAGTPIVSTGYA